MELIEKQAFIVYSDLKGFSKLHPEEQDRYLTVHIHLMSKVIRPFLKQAFVSNTWGDAIIAAFESGKDAADFMLNYRQEARKSMSIIAMKKLLPRIAGHYGKVNIFEDPLLDRLNIISDEVNTVARIEPITRPGEVFVSREFQEAFALQTGQQDKVKFERLGVIPLAKNYGEKELFRLINSNERTHIIDTLFELDFPRALPKEPKLLESEEEIIRSFGVITKKSSIQNLLENEWKEEHTGMFSVEVAKVCKKVGLYQEGIRWIERAQEEQIDSSGIALFPFKTEKKVVKLKADLLSRLDRYDESAEILYSLWRNIDGQSTSDTSEILAMLAAQFKRRALTKDNELLPKDMIDKVNLEKAASLYLEAFRYNIEDYYPAINAAYLLVILGGKQAQMGKQLARYISNIWGKEKGTNHWLDFTLAETELLQGFYDDAIHQMEEAFKTHSNTIGVFDIESTRLQIVQYLTIMEEELEGEELLLLLNRQLEVNKITN